MSGKEGAPGGLEAVRAFVNTRDLEDGTDELGSPAALAGWLRERGLMREATGASPADLERAHAVREALRAFLLANNGGALAPEAPAVLDAAARRAGLLAGFDADGRSRIEPTSRGVDAALGRLLAEVHAAMADGTWRRLKACADDACVWAFYDHSRNRSGTWCSMAVCGNRAKARAYRGRHAS